MQVVTAVYHKLTTQLLQLSHSLVGQSYNAMFCKPCVCKFISIKFPHFDSHSCWVSPSTQMYVRLSISQVERAVKRLLLYRRAAEDMEPPALARTTSPNFSELMSDPSNAQQMQEDLADELTRCAHSCKKQAHTAISPPWPVGLCWPIYAWNHSLRQQGAALAGSRCAPSLHVLHCSAMPLAKLGLRCPQAYASVCLLRSAYVALQTHRQTHTPIPDHSWFQAPDLSELGIWY